ncbi:MAG: dihydrodipicolinate synthase family protein [Rhizobiales bacterium]|nr:dihydrodipicolinate synthase family protein [Hyphomicrobiales bacterium]
MATLQLPTDNNALAPFTTSAPRRFSSGTRNFNRIAYSAAHVVAREEDAQVDWERTIAYRQYLWSLGLGVAEAMDTAQRGMGLDWPDAQNLIRYSLEAARGTPGALIASGVGTDHLAPADDITVDQIIQAYETQAEFVEKLGGRMIMMASRALAKAARGADDYIRVYDRILGGAKEPVILHWLGEMFDPALEGYWGTSDHASAMDAAIEIIGRNAAKVDGIKISLLDKDKEIAMRRRLPPSVRMYTGDDFNYPELIAGDGFGAANQGYSDALLGIFDCIAPAASAALHSLAQGNVSQYYEIMDPTVPLSRLIFEAPTRYYKTGVVFMAYLNGHQDHFRMIGDQQSARSIVHLSNVFRLADAAGLLANPELAAARMKTTLAAFGVA